jgi:predicted nucleotidyltransferase
LDDDLVDIVLFDSQLKDTNKQDSDYDILILVKNKTDWKLEREISDICYDIDLIDSDRLTVAVNRIYYGPYYSITTLAIKINLRLQNMHNLLDGLIRSISQQIF